MTPNLSRASLKVAVSRLRAREMPLSDALSNITSTLQHVLVLSAHDLADGFAGPNGLSHRRLPSGDGLSHLEYTDDVSRRNDRHCAAISHHIVPGVDRDTPGRYGHIGCTLYEPA